MSEEVITVKNVTKKFSYNEEPNIFSKLKKIRSRSENKMITATDNVSFTVNKGEVLGIIGENASGKTTLLRLIAGIFEPDCGQIKVKGNLAPILQLGIGFQGELDAVENIVLSGMLLGFSKPEIEKRVESVLQFADLEKFSTLKLKYFSSGMRARLGISTIFQLNPDIFLLDEILEVGDMNFGKKCFKAFMSFKEKGKTILYVTHSLKNLPEICDRVLLLHNGKLIKIGKPEEVIESYKLIVTNQ